MDLRYKYFAANVEMTVSGMPFIRPPGHHPVIGAGPTVSIESSDFSYRAETDRSTVLAELARFTESVYQRLVHEVAGIGGNPVVQRLRPSA